MNKYLVMYATRSEDSISIITSIFETKLDDVLAYEHLLDEIDKTKRSDKPVYPVRSEDGYVHFVNPNTIKQVKLLDLKRLKKAWGI